MLHFLPVCSKYAAVCSNRDFFPMSTPSRFFQHTKLALFPNFGALFLKITSGSHTAWTNIKKLFFGIMYLSEGGISEGKFLYQIVFLCMLDSLM